MATAKYKLDDNKIIIEDDLKKGDIINIDDILTPYKEIILKLNNEILIYQQNEVINNLDKRIIEDLNNYLKPTLDNFKASLIDNNLYKIIINKYNIIIKIINYDKKLNNLVFVLDSLKIKRNNKADMLVLVSQLDINKSSNMFFKIDDDNIYVCRPNYLYNFLSLIMDVLNGCNTNKILI